MERKWREYSARCGCCGDIGNEVSEARIHSIARIHPSKLWPKAIGAASYYYLMFKQFWTPLIFRTASNASYCLVLTPPLCTMADKLHENGELFHSPNAPLSSVSHIPDIDSPPPTAPAAQKTSASTERVFWISPPPIDPDEKAGYKSIFLGTPSIPSSDDEDETPVEVVGEIYLGTDHYYWVVHASDVIHRVSQCLKFFICLIDALGVQHLAKRLKGSYPKLVEVYSKFFLSYVN